MIFLYIYWISEYVAIPMFIREPACYRKRIVAYADSRLRPFALLFLITLRPPGVLILALNP